MLKDTQGGPCSCGPEQAIDVNRLAQLARLTLTDEEAQAMERDIRSQLAFLEALSAVDTQGVPADGTPLLHSALLREDVPAPSQGSEWLLTGAPQTEGGFILAPGVKGGDSNA